MKDRLSTSDPEDAFGTDDYGCAARHKGWCCTQRSGHTGPHKARGARSTPYCEWPLEAPAPAPTLQDRAIIDFIVDAFKGEGDTTSKTPHTLQ
jgi:hypothetical protein